LVELLWKTGAGGGGGGSLIHYGGKKGWRLFWPFTVIFGISLSFGKQKGKKIENGFGGRKKKKPGRVWGGGGRVPGNIFSPRGARPLAGGGQYLAPGGKSVFGGAGAWPPTGSGGVPGFGVGARKRGARLSGRKGGGNPRSRGGFVLKKKTGTQPQNHNKRFPRKKLRKVGF